MSIEFAAEPLVDQQDPLNSWELILPLRGVNLVGLHGGRLADKSQVGGNKFLALAEYEEGVHDASDIEPELSLDDPDHIPIVRVNHPNIRPTLWVVSDMLQGHQAGQDGYYDKRGLAISTIFSLLRTSMVSTEHIPSVLIASNDYRADKTDRPRGGKKHFVREIGRLTSLMEEQGPLPPLDERPKLSELLDAISSKATRSVVAVVSDFRGPNVWPDHPKDNWQASLDTLAQRKNEIIAVEITSPEDRQQQQRVERINHSPKDRLWTGKRGKLYRKQYSDTAPDQVSAINEALEAVGAIHTRLSTDSPDWHTSLTRQLKYPNERVFPER